MTHVKRNRNISRSNQVTLGLRVKAVSCWQSGEVVWLCFLVTGKGYLNKHISKICLKLRNITMCIFHEGSDDSGAILPRSEAPFLPVQFV